MQAQPSLGSALAMLFVGGDPAIAVKDDVADRFRPALGCTELHNSMGVDDERGKLSRKILGRWIARDTTESIMMTNLNLAMRYNLPEALPSAIKLLEREAAPKNLRYYALIIVGNYGTEAQLPIVQPLLKDTEVVYNQNPAVRAAIAQPQQANRATAAQTEMRDIALAVTIKLSGQDPKQFGFDLLNMTDQKRIPMESSQSRVGFRNEEDRAAAFQKWEDWKKDKKQAVVEKPKDGTVER
jgi:hypothetical protein